MNRSVDEITLFLCGDVMTGRGIDQILRHPGAPHLYEPYARSAEQYVELAERTSGPIPRFVFPEYVWGDALEMMIRKRPHLRIINLETSVTTSEDAAPDKINYRMHPDNLPVIRALGTDCCVLANNHVLDWGRDGMLDTLRHLGSAGITVAGAGRNAAEARAPAVLESSGCRILVFAMAAADSGVPGSWAAGEESPGVHLLPDLSERTAELIGAEVAGRRRDSDIAVASIHWGGNWGYEISRTHRRFAHALIERAGFDLVHGHSSHHPKGIEIHDGRPIFYGCGDFLNDYEGISGHEEFRDDLTLMYLVTFDPTTRSLVRLEMVPLQLRGFRLHRAAQSDRDWLRQLLDRECRRWGHEVTTGDESLFLGGW